MSVTFSPTFSEDGTLRLRCTCDDISPEEACAACCTTMNLCNRNAADLLEWLGVDPGQDLAGCILASDLLARCERRLWPEERNLDPPIAEQRLSERASISGREAGYLRQRTEMLRVMCKTAGAGWISWC